jgi:hypothetical protein
MPEKSVTHVAHTPFSSIWHLRPAVGHSSPARHPSDGSAVPCSGRLFAARTARCQRRKRRRFDHAKADPEPSMLARVCASRSASNAGACPPPGRGKGVAVVFLIVSFIVTQTDRFVVSFLRRQESINISVGWIPAPVFTGVTTLRGNDKVRYLTVKYSLMAVSYRKIGQFEIVMLLVVGRFLPTRSTRFCPVAGQGSRCSASSL